MKKTLLLTSLLLLISGCAPSAENLEAYCNASAACGDESQCQFCGETKVSSYAGCHSKEFCENTPME